LGKRHGAARPAQRHEKTRASWGGFFDECQYANGKKKQSCAPATSSPSAFAIAAIAFAIAAIAFAIAAISDA